MMKFGQNPCECFGEKKNFFQQKYFGNMGFGPNHSLQNFKKLKKAFFPQQPGVCTIRLFRPEV